MDCGFKFSVIMPIYNTEEYLEVAIESIINQDIGFSENVKLILIDDGSKDNSFEICQRYKEKYPDNIVAISKENGGQGSARNLGLEYVDSEYITFLDSDDKLSLNTLSAVYNYFLEHGEQIDIVSIPLVYFDAIQGDHILNYKFKTERIVDLEESPKYPQLAINSSFIKREAFKDYRFNTNLVTGEDSIIVNKILLDKKKIAFLNRARYFYRKRQDESSTVDNAKSKREFFVPRLRDYFKMLIDYSLEKEGFVPDFIQYLIAYDIQWYYNISDFPEFLSKDEIKDFWKYFYEILSYIDDEVINDKIIIKKIYVRSFLMYIKNHRDFYIDVDGFGSGLLSQPTVNLKTGDFTINELNKHNLYFYDVMIQDGFLKVHGSFTSSCNYDTLAIEATRTHGDGSKDVFKAGTDLEKSHVRRIFGIDWHYRYHFYFNIPMVEEDSTIAFNLIYEEDSNRIALNNHIRFKDDTILFNHVNHLVNEEYILIFSDDSFIITPFTFEKYNQLREELYSRIQDLIDRNKALERQNRRLERKNDDLKERNIKLKEALTKSRAKNKEIINSTSWKVTEPLRKSKHLFDN